MAKKQVKKKVAKKAAKVIKTDDLPNITFGQAISMIAKGKKPNNGK